jgi:enoyl-CoA hydratase
MSNAAHPTKQPGPTEPDSQRDDTGEGLVRTEQAGAVWIVTLNRPAVRNAIDGPTAQALTRAFQQFERTPHLAVAVLTGAGGTFCSGADLTTLSDEQRGLHLAEEGDAPLGVARMMLSKPCIAAIEGYAVAGGFELALWCDLRVAASNAVFGIYNHRWGIPCTDGATVLLPRLIGHSHALDLLLTGRSVSGEEARSMGLVNRLVAPGTVLQAALALAEEIVRFPQQCLRADRLSSYEQWSLSFRDALHNETQRSLPVIQSEETRAAARRFTQRER